MSDTIHIDELLFTLSLAGDDASDKDEHPQAILFSLTMPHDVSLAARSDDLALSINYAAVYTTLVEAIPNTHHTSLEALVDFVFETIFRAHPEVDAASVVVTPQDTSPRFALEVTRRRDQDASTAGPYRYVIRRLTFSTIVGVNPRERTETQPVVLDITLDRRQQRGHRFPFSALSASVRQTFAASAYLTIEALASAVARHVLEYTRDIGDEVTIKLSKPNALALAASAQVHITRRRDDFSDGSSVHGPMVCAQTLSSPHSVALALGSNLGDRFANIETALRLLEVPTALLSDLREDPQVAVVDTSFMYETAPMYVTDQPRFVNCACMIETNLSPKELLRLVKEIETAVGRVPSIRFGPRAVDVDILTYDDQLVDTRPPDSRTSLDNLAGELVIPHPRMCEREFVLRPLNDMIPHFVHPACNKAVRVLLDELISVRTEDHSPMLKVTPFPRYPLDDDTEAITICGVQVLPTAKHWTLSSTDPAQLRQRPHKTYLMATLNMTPDSFSDGALHNTLPSALAYTTAAVASGADIIDVGGYSTRPGATVVPPADELSRVLPIIRAIRAHPSDGVRRALVSIDTFRAEVAAEAVRAGANCINDVYAFTGPGYSPLGEDAGMRAYRERMRGVARALGVPVVLMHSRGDAGANKDYGAYDAKEGRGIVEAVQTELGRKVDAVVRGRGGVRRWLVFVDPGIGFSKPVGAQLALMRNLGRVTAEREDAGSGNALAGYPLLVGPSKKSVWGTVLEEGDAEGAFEGRKTHAQERGWATAAAVACAVQQGANAVRVHDVAEMRDVIAVASAIWNR